MKPLAEIIRPVTLDNVFGQHHLIGKNSPLRKIIENKTIPNMIFYGPPGTGKTTIANIIASHTSKTFIKVNATNVAMSEVKDLIKKHRTEDIILYVDEIQNFNKKQQQALLEYIEIGTVTLIASTTENPYFYIYDAILSRCSVFEFKPLNEEDIILAIEKAIDVISEEQKYEFTDEAKKYVADMASGDVRKAINIIELIHLVYRVDSKVESLRVDVEEIKKCCNDKVFRFDKSGDSHYDILSAFQKSIRGSDVNASLHYLARLVVGGDLPSICRRLLVIAAEDVGLADPYAITLTNSCVEAAFRLGFPEARIPLAEAVIYLSNAMKDNNTILAIDAAINDIKTKNCGEIPSYLKDHHYPGSEKLNGKKEEYLYPHNYPGHRVEQQYLPDEIKDVKYYPLNTVE